jgi:Coenzyme PQQ synthesis protein D (PqqD)
MTKDRKDTLPVAREDELVIQELADEMLVYDLRRHRAHCLNHTAALIWKHCDGSQSVSDLATVLERALKTKIDEELVLMALTQLSKSRLLKDQIEPSVTSEKVSRRQMMKRIGAGAAIALPLITSIIAPTAAQGASGLPNGTGCTSSAQCMSKCCRKTDLRCRPVGQGACL